MNFQLGILGFRQAYYNDEVCWHHPDRIAIGGTGGYSFILASSTRVRPDFLPRLAAQPDYCMATRFYNFDATHLSNPSFPLADSDLNKGTILIIDPLGNTCAVPTIQGVGPPQKWEFTYRGYKEVDVGGLGGGRGALLFGFYTEQSVSVYIPQDVTYDKGDPGMVSPPFSIGDAIPTGPTNCYIPYRHWEEYVPLAMHRSEGSIWDGPGQVDNLHWHGVDLYEQGAGDALPVTGEEDSPVLVVIRNSYNAEDKLTYTTIAPGSVPYWPYDNPAPIDYVIPYFTWKEPYIHHVKQELVGMDVTGRIVWSVQIPALGERNYREFDGLVLSGGTIVQNRLALGSASVYPFPPLWCASNDSCFVIATYVYDNLSDLLGYNNQVFSSVDPARYVSDSNPNKIRYDCRAALDGALIWSREIAWTNRDTICIHGSRIYFLEIGLGYTITAWDVATGEDSEDDNGDVISVEVPAGVGKPWILPDTEALYIFGGPLSGPVPFVLSVLT